MRTWLYHKEHPNGVIFDTEPNRPDPLIPAGWKMLGWVEHQSEIHMTQDQFIEAVVKQELARQKKDRKLEKEFEKKTGAIPHYAADSRTLEKVLDSPLAPPEERA